MRDTKDHLKEIGSYLLFMGLAGALYGSNVYCGSLAEKNRVAEAAMQREEKKKKMILEMEACSGIEYIIHCPEDIPSLHN
ncbi:MAG: hypothetical protein Q8R37_05065 [Nanoarchaeota archaeon]|nr:hypothetical protein [Nanoarchaeota archaeon]